tara:strand:+ start:453 stop:677 length:225 start_codon:yes stop_codon:yes gene_type:complete
MDTNEFKTKLTNSGLIGTSMGCASSINSRLEYALECVKMMEPNCDIEQKYLLIHIKSAMEMADEIKENLNKIEY